MNVSLPETLKSFVDARVKSGGFSSHSEYVRELVRKDEIAFGEAALKERLIASLSSPISRTWNDIEANLKARLQDKEI